MYLCSCSCPNAQHVRRAPPPWQAPPGKPEAQDERSRAELRCWSPHFSRHRRRTTRCCVAGRDGRGGKRAGGTGQRPRPCCPPRLSSWPPGRHATPRTPSGSRSPAPPTKRCPSAEGRPAPSSHATRQDTSRCHPPPKAALCGVPPALRGRVVAPVRLACGTTAGWLAPPSKAPSPPPAPRSVASSHRSQEQTKRLTVLNPVHLV